METNAAKLHNRLSDAGFKIISVSVGNLNDKSTWVVEPEDESVSGQVAAFIEQFELLESDKVQEIKAEANRRILLVMTEDQQRNTLAAGQAAIMKFGADLNEWPKDLHARQQEAMTAWAEIERLRARSNELEKAPLTVPVTTDDLWV